MPELVEKDWPHAPVHRLSTDGVFMVTAGTHYKAHWFNTPEKLNLLENHLLKLAKRYNWQLEAWAVFSNHYHFVARSQADATHLRIFLKHLHDDSARDLNQLDQLPGRKIWYNFQDSKLS